MQMQGCLMVQGFTVKGALNNADIVTTIVYRTTTVVVVSALIALLKTSFSRLAYKCDYIILYAHTKTGNT